MSGLGLRLLGVGGVDLDIWPPIIRRAQASCRNRSGFLPENTSSICWISCRVSFSMMARGVSIHERVLGDTDPCLDAHPYLKGCAGDLWVAPLWHAWAMLHPQQHGRTTRLSNISLNYNKMI